MKKKGQSEIAGFAIILVIVAVIMLIFLSFSLNKSNEEFTQSYEVDGFIQASLEYTTVCAQNYEPNYLSIRKVLVKCVENDPCYSEAGIGPNPCKILNETLTDLVKSSWNVGEDWPTKGYVLNITNKGEELFSLEEGNITKNSKGSSQEFEGGLTVQFIVYN